MICTDPCFVYGIAGNCGPRCPLWGTGERENCLEGYSEEELAYAIEIHIGANDFINDSDIEIEVEK